MNEIATIDVSTALNPFRDQLAEFKSQFDNVVYDLRDETENKQARSDRLAVGKVISALDARHKEIKAPLQVAVKLVDGERKEIKDDLLEVQGKIKLQIDTHEAAIKARSDEILERINVLRQLIDFGGFHATISELSDRLKAAEQFPIDDTLDDHKGWAALSKTETIEKLKDLHTLRTKYDADQAELARLREKDAARERAEQDERIRQEAEAKAKREAQEAVEAAEQAQLKAEQDAKDAAERAEREAQEAVERNKQTLIDAKAKAERAAKAQAEADRRAVEEAEERGRREAQEAHDAKIKAAQDAKAKEDKRKSRQAHRNKIHKAILDAFLYGGLNNDDSTLAVSLIQDGKIAHVGIEY